MHVLYTLEDCSCSSLFLFLYFFFCCCCYCGNSNDCKTMLPHLLVLYTSYIQSRYVRTYVHVGKEREKEQKKKGKRWKCTVTGTNPFCFHHGANGRVFVFRIFASFSSSVTKDKCLFCPLKLSKRRGRRRARSHLARIADDY